MSAFVFVSVLVFFSVFVSVFLFVFAKCDLSRKKEFVNGLFALAVTLQLSRQGHCFGQNFENFADLHKLGPILGVGGFLINIAH